MKRMAFFLPNTFTALNMACGFVAVIYSWRAEFYSACMFLFLGAIFDSVDGRIARMTGTQSSFGEQFDSLSDALSFGLAPSLIFYNRFFTDLGKEGVVISFLFLLCGALRLARFNANIDKMTSNYFQGLPIPSAAMAIIGYVLLSLDFPNLVEYKVLSALYLVFYSILMISNIPFYSFKNSEWVKTHKKTTLAIMFMIFASIFAYEKYMIAFIAAAYVLLSLLYFLKHRGELQDVFVWKDKENEI